jgi:hypothetical protein
MCTVRRQGRKGKSASDGRYLVVGAVARYLKELSSVVCGRPGGLGIGGWTISDGAAGEESC